MIEGRKEHYLNITFFTFNKSTFSSSLSSVIFYFQSLSIQMLKARVDYNIILVQTTLKDPVAMINFLDYF